MLWTRLATTVSAALLAGWATCAVAADDEYGRSGPYLSAGAVYAFADFDGGNTSEADGSWGYNLSGGYRFNEYFALEVDWEQLPAFEDGSGDADSWLIAVNAKVFPFHGIIQPYAVAGAGYMSVNDDAANKDDQNAGFRFGGGVDFYITRNWAIEAEAGYVLSIGSLSDYAQIPISLGVVYRFY
jgi:opacity protein-like surface antigen